MLQEFDSTGKMLYKNSKWEVGGNDKKESLTWKQSLSTCVALEEVKEKGTENLNEKE